MSILDNLNKKLNAAKPSNLDDEAKATVLGRIKMTAAFTAGVLATATTVALVSYYKSFSDENPETDDIDETTEN